MLRNYFKITIRALLRHKLFSAVNILGLAIGMSAFLLILLFVKDEMSFDQYHLKKKNIYRVNGTYARGGASMEPSSSSNFALAPLLKSVFPQIENYTRLYITPEAVKYKDKINLEKRVCYADSSLLDLFTFQFIKGNPAKALDEPNTVVLTETIAKNYFGDKDALGELIHVNGKLLKVTGVIKEMPLNSHFHADLLIPVSTVEADYPEYMRHPNTCGTSHYAYLLLPENYNPEDLQSQFPDFIRKHIGTDHNKHMSLSLIPLEKIHLYSHAPDELEQNGDINYIYLFGIIALVILLIACINYVNLTTARIVDRAKEIGLRKVTGASKFELIKQFLGESILVSLSALLIACLITVVSLPALNSFTGKELSFGLNNNLLLYLLLLGFSILIGILVGIYPAFLMSSFNITHVLKGNISNTGSSSLTLRKGLVVFQFCTSIILIISALLVYSQLKFIRNHKLGIVPEQLVTIMMTEKASHNYQSLKTDLLQNSNILSVTSLNNVLTTGGTNWRQYRWKGNSDKDNDMATMEVDVDFFSTLKAEIIKGRDFSKDFPADVSDSYIVNEKAAKLMGHKEPVGQRLLGSLFNGKEFGNKYGKIIGVVKDFHFASLHQEIKPVVFNLQSPQTDLPSVLVLRLNSKNMNGTIDHIKSSWKKVEPEFPIGYTFMDEDFQNLYQAEENFLKIFIAFTCLAVFIACLGIFGLTFYTTSQRAKEIGIRKVIGASVATIVILLSKDFIKLVFLAFIIATPIAWYLMFKWLEDFAYKTHINGGIFIAGGIITLAIAWFTVSYQSLKVALSNPVKSLRSE